MRKKLFMVDMLVSQPVFAESREAAIRVAIEDDSFCDNQEYDARDMYLDNGLPSYLRGCLVFHDGDDDLTIEDAFAMQKKDG